jgi:hypothetical protein
MRVRAVLPLLLIAAPPLGAQTDASIGAGAGPIRYAGGAPVGTIGLSTSIGFTTAAWALSGAAALGPIPDDRWAAQGGVDAWVAWPTDGALRPALTAGMSGSAQTGGPGTTAFRALGELVDQGRAVAVGAGAAAGRINAEPAAAGPWLRLRAWRRWRGALVTVAVEPQALAGRWFTDVNTGAVRRFGALEAAASASVRVSQAYGSRGAVSGGVELAVAGRWSVEAAGGLYLPDLYQGFPASAFASAGVRYFFSPQRNALARVARAPLVARRRGDSVEVRVRLPAADSVAIAGDWSGWTPVPLTPAGRGVWTGRFALHPGTYRFNVVVDGARWTVPPGVATMADELDGETAILVVP